MNHQYDPDIVIHEQLETCVYVDRLGRVVINQPCHGYGDDTIIAICAEHVPALLRAIEAVLPYAGFRNEEPEPDLFDDEPQPESVPQPETIYTPPPDRRELIRAALFAGGKSNRQIAADLNCSEATVRRVAATLLRLDRDAGATLAPPDAADDASMTPVFSSEEGQAA
jgi:hypothetical protein